jgi:hypothetical protein
MRSPSQTGQHGDARAIPLRAAWPARILHFVSSPPPTSRRDALARDARRRAPNHRHQALVGVDEKLWTEPRCLERYARIPQRVIRAGSGPSFKRFAPAGESL